MTNSKPLIISRRLRAPRALVFKVWTDADHLLKWFGPPGMTITIGKMDFRPGGIFHYGMNMPDGNTMWGKWAFVSIKEPERLELIQCFSDAAGGLGRHPMAPDWPRYTRSVTTFEESNGETILTIEWTAHEPTASEQAIFDASHEGMKGGWAGTFDKLDQYLASIQ